MTNLIMLFNHVFLCHLSVANFIYLFCCRTCCKLYFALIEESLYVTFRKNFLVNIIAPYISLSICKNGLTGWLLDSTDMLLKTENRSKINWFGIWECLLTNTGNPVKTCKRQIQVVWFLSLRKLWIRMLEARGLQRTLKLKGSKDCQKVVFR